jgi:hypothetical protein
MSSVEIRQRTIAIRKVSITAPVANRFRTSLSVPLFLQSARHFGSSGAMARAVFMKSELINSRDDNSHDNYLKNRILLKWCPDVSVKAMTRWEKTALICEYGFRLPIEKLPVEATWVAPLLVNFTTLTLQRYELVLTGITHWYEPAAMPVVAM